MSKYSGRKAIFDSTIDEETQTLTLHHTARLQPTFLNPKLGHTTLKSPHKLTLITKWELGVFTWLCYGFRVCIFDDKTAPVQEEVRPNVWPQTASRTGTTHVTSWRGKASIACLWIDKPIFSHFLQLIIYLILAQNLENIVMKQGLLLSFILTLDYIRLSSQ